MVNGVSGNNNLLEGKKAFVFDCDGTLVYFKIDVFSARKDVIKILVKYGAPASILSLDQTIAKMVEKSTPIISSQKDSDIKIASMSKEIDQAIEKYEIEAAHKTSLIPGTIEVLQKLKSKGFKLGIFTLNKNSTVNSLLDRVGIRSFFDVIVARDDVEKPKPDSHHLYKTLSLLGVTAEQAIIVGDHPTDMISAQNVGAKSIGVLSSGHSADELKSAGADLILKDISLIIPELLTKNKLGTVKQGSTRKNNNGW
ncbi:MAG: HAD family hydrolase [Candidatus Freyarchaeum deiterrae]